MFGSATPLLNEILRTLRAQTEDFSSRPQIREWLLDGLMCSEGRQSIGLNDAIEKLYLGVEYVQGADVRGDIAEFGTQYAITASAIAIAMREFRSNRVFHLFDSFQGLPKVTSARDLASPHVKANCWVEGALVGFSPEGLKAVVSQYIPAPTVKVYPGFFSQSLPQVFPHLELAMVHIDCDLYQSAKDVLDHLFSNAMLTEGAIIFFDDYNCNRCSPEFGERRAWRETVESYNVEFSDGGMHGWAGQRFYVHNYNGMLRR